MLDFLDRNADFFLGGEVGLVIVLAVFAFLNVAKSFLCGFAILMAYLI